MATEAQQVIRFGIIGGGLMGREFAAAAARWAALDAGGGGLDFRPQITAICDVAAPMRQWFERNVPSVGTSTDDYRKLLDDPQIDALYVAVPHNLHEQLYTDVIRSGKALLGEKPFGIDRAANDEINEALAEHPRAFVRCSSEFPFFPGVQRVAEMVVSGAFGRIIEVESGFWHSSDLNPEKPVNWKRRIATCGEYGCLGDLGMHALHLPLRFGWRPTDLRAVLSNLVTERPDGKGGTAPCETWDNGTLFCRVESAAGMGGGEFPVTVSTKRIAPGHNNTWFIRIAGTENSAYFTTQNPKVLRTLPYRTGGSQAWHLEDVPFKSTYDTITAGIFEFGFTDAILQMWAAFCDELVRGPDDMIQPNKPGGRPFYCVTAQEAADHHAILTAALESQKNASVVKPDWSTTEV